MKYLKQLVILFILSFVLQSCFKDRDDFFSNNSIHDFVWKAMNFAYVYQENISDLNDNRFDNNQIYQDYLNSFESPESLFESLIYDRENIDRFSWITDDYIALEQRFQGITQSNGMEFGLIKLNPSSDAVVGYITHILPNSEASNLSLHRGQLFNAIDNTALTLSNWNSLLSQTSYTLHLAQYNTHNTIETDDDTVDSTENAVFLTKTDYTENPIFKQTILTVAEKKVGYLMYNGFTANFDSALNTAFATFKLEAINALVLDLRYNRGGSVNSASILGSLITGESTENVFTKLNYNTKLVNKNSIFNFTNTLSDNTVLNTLKLQKLYVLTSKSTASASEMIINSLKPYIDVVTIGTNTTGKSQASITLYDSPDFTRNNINPTHLYALQPLVALTVNKNDVMVPSTGIAPLITIQEQINNLGVLGTPSEPLLAKALMLIENSGKYIQALPKTSNAYIDSKQFEPYSYDMIIN